MKNLVPAPPSDTHELVKESLEEKVIQILCFK